MRLLPASKSLFTISFSFLNSLKQNIISLNKTAVLRPKLLNASWFLINLHFLLPHIVHFDNIIALPLIVLETFGFMFSVFFIHFKQ